MADKGRKYEDEGNDGEDHARNGTDGKIEPENLLGTVGKEWQETEDSRRDCQHYRIDFMVVGLHVTPYIIANITH